MAKKRAFDHMKLRGLGFHAAVDNVLPKDTQGEYHGHARIIDPRGMTKTDFNKAIMEALIRCPVGRQVVTFIPADYKLANAVPSSESPLLKESEFLVFRDTVKGHKDEPRRKVIQAIEGGEIDTHLIDLPKYGDTECVVLDAWRKKGGGEPQGYDWDRFMVKQTARLRKRKLMAALRKVK